VLRACLSLLLLTLLFAHRPAKRPPNIILILTDDLGWSSLSVPMDDRMAGSMSDYHETPRMEAFARQSLRFTRGYAPDPICSPTRRSLQFGQSSIRQDDGSFDSSHAPRPGMRWRTIAQVLKDIDPRYRAAHFGKWDLRAGRPPEAYGYDESDGDTGNGQGNAEKGGEEKWNTHLLRENPKQIDSLTARAVDFLRRQGAAGNPFYLQVSHYATHANMETRAGSYARFAGKAPGRKHDKPAWAGMLYDLDRSVGQLLDELDSLGLSGETYVFLMSDNGGVEFIPPVSKRLEHPSTFDRPMRNHPLRGGKWTLYEGGIRVPFLVRGPGIRPGQTDVPVIGWDLLPTIASMAGGRSVAFPDIDGVDLKALITGRATTVVRPVASPLCFHRYHNGYPHSAILSGRYKLIIFWKTGKRELYDLDADAGELDDLSARMPERVRAMEGQLTAYMDRVNPGLRGRYATNGADGLIPPFSTSDTASISGARRPMPSVG
jgi:arylsulfatase A-like enzyme